MERQFLESFGLEKAQIDSILNEHSKDIGAKVNEINSLNSKVQSLETTIEELNGKVDTANSTITNLKNSNKDNEGLQQKVTEYQNKIKEMQESFDQERKNNAILSELRNSDFIDPELAIHLIDQDKVVKAKDGTYSGLTEQIEAITSNEKYSYLRNTPSGENNEVAAPEIDRGGYDPTTMGFDPVKAEPPKPQSIGAIIGAEFEEQAKNQADSAKNFWDQL